jgi:SAM-dependent methyltransferase
MKEFWNERYSAEDFAYGEEPNKFFKEQLSKLKPGTILLPADGEGRNGVSAAKLGWGVECFDISSEGKNKADLLAKKYDLLINYQVGSLEELTYEKESFDVIALVFTHFHPSIRAEYHKKFMELLKPGGFLISETFSKEHIAYNSVNSKVGGPKDIDFLSSLEQIREEFLELDIVELYQREILLNEGAFHIGKGDVVRFVGRKK